MPVNNLTAKEVTLITDLLTYEQTACKKARLYAKQMTDQTVAQELNKIADNHQKRFNALWAIL